MQRLLDLLVALLHRIQFWAVRWEIDEPEAFAISPQECPKGWAFVPRPAIQKHYQPRVMLQEPFEKADYPVLIHGVVERCIEFPS
jgi:hypothetical protein